MQHLHHNQSTPSKGDFFESTSLSKGYFYNNEQLLQQNQDNNHLSSQQQINNQYQEDNQTNQQPIQSQHSIRRRTRQTPVKQQLESQTNNESQQITQKKISKGHRRTNKKRNIKELQQQDDIQILDDQQSQKHDQMMFANKQLTKQLTVQIPQRKNKHKIQEIVQLDDLQADNYVEQNIDQNLIDNTLPNKSQNTESQTKNKKYNQQVVFQQQSSQSQQGQSPGLLTNSQPVSQPSSQSPQKLTSNNNSQIQQNTKKQITKQHMFKILTYPVKNNMVMKTNIERVNSFLFNAYPQYHMYFESDKTYLMSAKRVSRTPFSTFVISKTKDKFQQGSQQYLGKAKGSAIGDQLNLFDSGLSPANALLKNTKPRQLLASVIYQTRIILSGQPRQFKVYIKKPQIDYYNSFPQMKWYGQQIPLHLLYQNPHNRDKIMVLKNKKPQYHAQIKGYSLNFKGRVGTASVKNFVLQRQIQQLPQQQNNRNQQNNKIDLDPMIFGKSKDNIFNMDISQPLSPLIAFGIALSSFDQKYFCQ